MGSGGCEDATLRPRLGEFQKRGGSQLVGHEGVWTLKGPGSGVRAPGDVTQVGSWSSGPSQGVPSFAERLLGLESSSFGPEYGGRGWGPAQ